MTYKSLIDSLEQFVETHQKSIFVVKYIAIELSGVTPSEFYLMLNDEVDESLYQKIKQVIEQYVFDDIPVDYLLGYRYFYGYKFEVNEHVLIPRNETEELVQYVLMYIDTVKKPLRILDLGTGSGCIGLTIKKEAPENHVILSDISKNALDLVTKNAKNLNVDVTIKQSDWLSSLNQVFDIIVSNPPYIPDEEQVGDTVDHEPHLALYGGVSGLAHYETILKNISQNIHYGSLIAFEHGYQHKDGLHQLIFEYLKDVHVLTVKDMQGRDRMTFILNKKIPFHFLEDIYENSHRK